MHKVIIDTCVWSAVLRRNQVDLKISEPVLRLIENSQIVFIGPIRQELLSGIKDENQFNKLKDALSIYADEIIDSNDYILAAEFNNQCRSKGIQGSAIDYLICAFSQRRGYHILTLDNDFLNYQKVIPISLEPFD